MSVQTAYTGCAIQRVGLVKSILKRSSIRYLYFSTQCFAASSYNV